mgnify:CR=1 FL=1
MRNSFKEYYGLSSSELKKLWKEGLIVFDTNVLLSLYRCSQGVRNDFISMINSLSDRIWIPYQVGYEFHEHRLEEAMRPIEAVMAIKGKLQKFESVFEQEYGNNPYLDNKKIKTAFKAFSSRLDKMIQESLTSCPEFLKEDEFLNVLTESFDGKTGPDYQEKRLAEIYRIGSERYSNKIPPGYKDAKKHEGDRHRFGDLIIWLQIIDQAKANAKDIIFVTDDKKEDWWEMYKDNRIGPRHELIREFREKTINQLIWFYTPDRFLQYAKSKVGVSVKSSTIEEVKNPSIDWTSIIGQSTLPGQVSLDTRWPWISLGESDSLDIGLTSRNSSIPGMMRLFSSRSLGEIGDSDRREYSGLIGEGLASSGMKEDSINSELDEGEKKEIPTSKPVNNEMDNNQDKSKQ